MPQTLSDSKNCVVIRNKNREKEFRIVNVKIEFWTLLGIWNAIAQYFWHENRIGGAIDKSPRDFQITIELNNQQRAAAIICVDNRQLMGL